MLESFYEVPRERVAELMRAAIGLPSIRTVDPPSLLRALEIYEVDRLNFAEAYLVAPRRGDRRQHRALVRQDDRPVAPLAVATS